MPHLRELYEKHKEDGLVVIGIHTKNQGELRFVLPSGMGTVELVGQIDPAEVRAALPDG